MNISNCLLFYKTKVKLIFCHRQSIHTPVKIGIDRQCQSTVGHRLNELRWCYFAFRQDDGTQLNQDAPELFSTKPGEDDGVFWRDPNPGPTFGDQIRNFWGHRAQRFGSAANAPVVDPQQPGHPEGVCYNPGQGIFDWRKLRGIQTGRYTRESAKLADLPNGAVVACGDHYVAGLQSGGRYLVGRKGTWETEQVVTTSPEAGSCIGNGVAVHQGRIYASTDRSHVVGLGSVSLRAGN